MVFKLDKTTVVTICIIVCLLIIIYLLSRYDIKEELINTSTAIKRAKSTYNYRELGVLYYNNANLLEIKPNITDAEVLECIKNYKKAYKYGNRDSLFKIANIYHYGIQNRGINTVDAFKYYVASYNNMGLGDSRKETIVDRIIQLSTETNIDYITDFITYTGCRSQRLVDTLNNNRTTYMIHDTPINYEPPVINYVGGYEVAGDLNDDFIPGILQHMFDREYTNGVAVIQQVQIGNIGGIYDGGDNQNVHDPNVMNTMKTNLDNMTSFDGDKRVTLEEIKRLLSYNESAMKTYDTILEQNTYIVKYDMNETDILVKVYNHIKTLKEPDRQNALKIFEYNMANAVEYNKVVCATGRVNRIVASLDGIDDSFVSPVTDQIKRETLNNEILQTAAKFRDDNENMDDEEFKTQLYDHLYKKYVTAGLTTEQYFKDYVQGWIDAI